ncbi:MAG: hypothetical protein WCS43_03625, partial [Verrucomicrobiota bacterium]
LRFLEEHRMVAGGFFIQVRSVHKGGEAKKEYERGFHEKTEEKRNAGNRTKEASITKLMTKC